VPGYPVTKSERIEAYYRSAWTSNTMRTYAPGNLWSFSRVDIRDRPSFGGGTCVGSPVTRGVHRVSLTRTSG
jgi:hypothetical protein